MQERVAAVETGTVPKDIPKTPLTCGTPLSSTSGIQMRPGPKEAIRRRGLRDMHAHTLKSIPVRMRVGTLRDFFLLAAEETRGVAVVRPQDS